ncbi:endonuclease/exonuclease/phosphatase family protein [Paenibacillus thermotolerans]|uniref:endonuclease/exonuclease/phosphatase family protein n=1 Tax=Paenibacillus thermotolerans TaxID=3027807 RepID=UPI002367464F|nr:MULTISPECIES: endonuclease/exonuclease/phosphatase family protein [unclassified Paenibacillus]
MSETEIVTESKGIMTSVMTFNLRRSSWTDRNNAWRFRKRSVAETILRSGAEFIGTQEGLPLMLKELDGLLPGYGRVGQGRDGGSKGEHCAIYYVKERWKPAEHGTFWLSVTPELPASRGWGAMFPRICTWAVFEPADGGIPRLAVYNVHLDHISGLARERGAALAAARLIERRAASGVPAVLVGDFNSSPRRPAVAQLSAPPYSLVDACDELPGGAAAAGATYHAFRGGGEGGKPIDYIFATDDIRIEQIVVDREKCLGRFPSDHYPVIAHISLP